MRKEGRKGSHEALDLPNLHASAISLASPNEFLKKSDAQVLTGQNKVSSLRYYWSFEPLRLRWVRSLSDFLIRWIFNEAVLVEELALGRQALLLLFLLVPPARCSVQTFCMAKLELESHTNWIFETEDWVSKRLFKAFELLITKLVVVVWLWQFELNSATAEWY